MFCRNCGFENDKDASFCAQCGSRLDHIEQDIEVEISKSDKQNKNWKTIIIVEILLIACAIVALLFFLGKRKEKQYEQEIVFAARYLETLDYEKAEAAYLAAIEIDPKQEIPYIRLAEIYVAQEKPEKAREILKQGYEETESQAILEKYSLYTYVNEVLIPEIGTAIPGIYEISYQKDGEYYKACEFHDLSGVITSRIQDFDGDGMEDLLVAVMRNDVVDYEYSGEINNSVFLQMYELKEGQVVLCAEMEACADVFGGYDAESDGIFLKTVHEKTYICGGKYGLRYLFADGSSYMSFVVTYENNSFVDYTGDRVGQMGSDFSWNVEKAEEMATKLDDIQLPMAAADVRESDMLRMTYEDEMDDTLFRIQGENVGGDSMEFYQSYNVEDLGKIALELWIGEGDSHFDMQSVDEPETKLTEAEWKSLYRDFIIQDMNEIANTEVMEYANYQLLYLDEDTVPELYIDYIFTYMGENLANIYGGTVHSRRIEDGSLTYVEQGNVFKHGYGRQGYYGDTIYTLDNGNLTTLSIGSYEATLNTDGSINFEVMDYTWNGNPVSEYEYQKKLEESIPPTAARSTSENGIWYTYDEILNYLQ